MKIHNILLNTYPLFVHAQGLVRKTKEWEEVINNSPKIKNDSLSKDITIISFMFGELDFPLKKQLEKSKINYINAIPKDLKTWKNTGKIKYLLSAINKVKTPYILCLDATDVICAENLSELINRLKSFDADIVYNASKNNYPKICKIEEPIYIDTPFRFLNAGMFIGKTEAIKEFYQYVVDNELYKNYDKFDDSEQLRIRLARSHYPKRKKIKVDTGCVIFQTLSRVRFKLNNNVLSVLNNNVLSIKPIKIGNKISDKIIIGVDSYGKEEDFKISCYCKFLSNKNKILKNVRKIEIPEKILDNHKNNDSELIKYVAQTQLIDIVDTIKIKFKINLFKKILQYLK